MGDVDGSQRFTGAIFHHTGRHLCRPDPTGPVQIRPDPTGGFGTPIGGFPTGSDRSIFFGFMGFSFFIPLGYTFTKNILAKLCFPFRFCLILL